MNTRSHDEYRENIAAYVLGALPELEQEVLERHLTRCETCSTEVARLMPVTNAIARSVPQVEPPPSLKASLMRVVNEEAQLRNAAEGERPREARREREPRRLPAWLGGLRPRLATAMALGVLAIGVAVGLTVSQSGGGSGERTIAAQVDRGLMRTGGARLHVSDNGDDAVIEVTDAPEPPSGRAYQLWVQRGKTIKPGPTFKVGSDGSVAQRIPGGIHGAVRVMVTVERAGGAFAPTGNPVMTFDV